MSKVSAGCISPFEQKTRCKRWRLRVMVDGKEKTRLVTGTKQEAKKELERFRAELMLEHVPGESMLVREYFDAYADARMSNKAVKESTVERWRSEFKAVCFHIGNVKMSELTPAMVEDAYKKMREGDTLSGKPSSGTYLASINSTCYGAFKKAVRDGVVKSNPFDSIDRPKVDTRERKALTAEHAAEVVAMLDPYEKQHIAIMLMLFQGLRRSEAVNVRWDDVDFDSRTIRIENAKTEAGVRVLPMSSLMYDALSVRRDWLRRRRVPENYVVSDWGDPITPHAVNKWWERHAAEFGLEGYTPHELRHTFATLLAEADVHPKMMQGLLGHSSPLTSMRIYAHVHDEAKRDAMAALDEQKLQRCTISRTKHVHEK